MSSLQLTPDALAELKQRHLDFLARRLTSDAARQDWAASLAAGYDWLLGLPVRDVLAPEALASAIGRLLDEQVVRGLVGPVAQEVGRRVLASVRTDDAKLGDYVPAEARAAIDELLARPDLVPESLVRRIFEQEAIEEVLRNVLYDALKEFNDNVNPFFADWGLPALIKRFVPIGGGTILKSMDAVRTEFDKRLDPEMRKFLLVFSRKAKAKIADLTIAKSGGPTFVELRRNVAAFLYEESLAELVAGIDDQALSTQQRAALAIGLEMVRRERPRERLKDGLVELLREHGDRTVGEALAAIGVTARPDLAALADVTWPAVKAVMASHVATNFFTQLVTEFYAELASS